MIYKIFDQLYSKSLIGAISVFILLPIVIYFYLNDGIPDVEFIISYIIVITIIYFILDEIFKYYLKKPVAKEEHRLGNLFADLWLKERIKVKSRDELVISNFINKAIFLNTPDFREGLIESAKFGVKGKLARVEDNLIGRNRDFNVAFTVFGIVPIEAELWVFAIELGGPFGVGKLESFDSLSKLNSAMETQKKARLGLD